MVRVKFYFMERVRGTLLRRWTFQGHRRGTKLQEYVKHGDAKTNAQLAQRAKFNLIRQLWADKVGQQHKPAWDARAAAAARGAEPLPGYNFYLSRGLRAWISAQLLGDGTVEVSCFVPFSTERLYIARWDVVFGYVSRRSLTASDQGQIITFNDGPKPPGTVYYYIADSAVGTGENEYQAFCNAKEDRQAGTATEAVLS